VPMETSGTDITETSRTMCGSLKDGGELAHGVPSPDSNDAVSEAEARHRSENTAGGVHEVTLRAQAELGTQEAAKEESTNKTLSSHGDTIDDRPSQKAALPEHFHLEQSLFRPSSSAAQRESQALLGGCFNAYVLKQLFRTSPSRGSNTQKNKETAILEILRIGCLDSWIKECTNDSCQEAKHLMEQMAPRCEWKAFRTWAITTMSCLSNVYPRLPANEEGDGQPFPEWFVHHIGVWVQEGIRYPIDIMGVCELVCWVMDIAISFAPDQREFRKRLRWINNNSLKNGIFTTSVLETLTRATTLGVCRKRLWSLIESSPNGELDLSSLVSLGEQTTLREFYKHAKHETCTSETCYFTDDNSSPIEQLHLCTDFSCGRLAFPSSQIEVSDKHSAWRTGVRELLPPAVYEGDSYAAISHVWSDGTGSGIGEPGMVNTCLVAYFDAILERVGCSGLWWDTISVPTERKARTKALNNMHKNFQRAECTVVHDRYLLQFPWADDGSPCLALLLSPWFTRGWTALELMMSKSVKVLYRGESPQKPLIKDLDTEILAQNQAITTRGHFAASTIIQQLRKQKVHLLRDLHTILGTRATSYARDRMIIAALLADLPIPTIPDWQAQLTRDIIKKFGMIESAFLLHGHATQQDQGPWSWCPSTLFYVHTGTHQRHIETSPFILKVTPEGSVGGSAFLRPLDAQTASDFRPYTFHTSVAYKIKAALQDWENYLLLRPFDMYKRLEQRLAILVQPFAVEDVGGVVMLDCTYVGTVCDFEPYDWATMHRIVYRLGCEPKATRRTAKNLGEECLLRTPLIDKQVQFSSD